MPTPTTSTAARKLDKLYEFDREPVSKDRLLGPGHFAGSYAGEHVAATEFVIGVLFVNWGASVADVFFGLLIGNLLAVATWTLLCAPIAVDTRLTLYWYLRKIGGPMMTVIYNVLNALLYCILAGCMITVSASAIRIPFGIEPQVKWYPTDIRFVLVALGVGAVVVTLAVLGFEKLASFATVCSPWMLLMFLAGALAMLPQLSAAAGYARIDGWDQFFDMAHKVIWTGTTPDGSLPLGFWKVAAFAWICNLAMHAGLSDMALFRYAPKASYGLFSAFGMFLGHYAAWIAAGMMGAGAALAMRAPLPSLDSGEVAYQALGAAGILAVVIAGWTTSNPTLYRAGLALQAVTPNWSRAKVTIAAGTVTTIVACFPFVFTRLLEFVGIYGLLLAPAGAIVVTEHWIFPRIGLTRYWASYRNLLLNWPALAAWFGSLGVGLLLERTGVLHLFFLFLPVYILSSLLYILLASFAGAKQHYEGTGENHSAPKPTPPTGGVSKPKPVSNSKRKWIAGVLSLVALTSCLGMAIPVALAGGAEAAARVAFLKNWLMAPTLVYFVSGTLFLRELRRRTAKT